VRGGAGDTGTVKNDTGLQDLIIAIDATATVTNPKANSDTYGGTFVVSKVTAKDENADGTGERRATIVQTLTKVKAVTDVASLGTPDKGADKQTLNYLGFKEGAQNHRYKIYRNLNPANRSVTMTLSPNDTGYTIVKRKFDVEEDKTGTFTVVLENDTWGTVGWKSKVKVGYINYDARTNPNSRSFRGGAGLEEEQQLTGVSHDCWANVVTKAIRGDTNRVATRVTVIERNNGEYVVNQGGAISYNDTNDSSAIITALQSSFGGGKPKSARRIWPRRTYFAKTKLLASKAVSNYVIGSDTYIHDVVHVQDNHDGTFDVVQDLGNMTQGGGIVGSAFFNDSVIEWKRYTRSKDNAIKRIKYIHKIRSFSSAANGWGWVSDQNSNDTNGYKVVLGSGRVSKKGSFIYEADCLLTKNMAAYNLDWQ
jgi:hypothetical protein